MLETIQKAKLGSVIPVYKEINEELDPVASFSQLSNAGSKKHCIFAKLQVANGAITIASSHPALVLTGKQDDFEILPLSEQGRKLLPLLKKKLNFCDKIVHSKGRLYGTLTFKDRPVPEEQKRNIKTHFDIIKTLATLFTQAQAPFTFSNSVVGFVSADKNYETSEYPTTDRLKDNDYVCYLLEELVVVNHAAHTSYLIANAFVTDSKRDKTYADCSRALKRMENTLAKKHPKEKKPSKKKEETSFELSQEDFKDIIRKSQKALGDGTILSLQLPRFASQPADTTNISMIEESNRNDPLFFAVQDVDGFSLSRMPTNLLRATAGKHDVTFSFRTDARTRGYNNGIINPLLDAKHEVAMKRDKSELRYHTVMLDAVRNELAGISKAGTQQLPQLFAVEKDPHFQVLQSTIFSELDEGSDGIDALKKMMSLTHGVPSSTARDLTKTLGAAGMRIGTFFITNSDLDVVALSTYGLRIKKGIVHFAAPVRTFHKRDPEKELTITDEMMMGE